MLGSYAAYLLAHGEKMHNVAHMSIRQMDAMCNVYKQRDKGKLVELATSVRMAQAEQKDWKKFIAEIERE